MILLSRSIFPRERFPQRNQLLDQIRPQLKRSGSTDHYEGEDDPDPSVPLWRSIRLEFDGHAGSDLQAILQKILSGFQELMAAESGAGTRGRQNNATGDGDQSKPVAGNKLARHVGQRTFRRVDTPSCQKISRCRLRIPRPTRSAVPALSAWRAGRWNPGRLGSSARSS
jgi:hypothetical protein